ncbi:MAG: GNAT family N-acetyltransferase [Betaproteobacteria bacterium]|nr:GNAT family N-acetyltransferase [Betaproteobacteria bacterium]
MLSDNVTLREIEPDDYQSVLALIVEGLTQRWGNYDPAMNPDLEKFPEQYIDSVILVAEERNELLAVGILRQIGHEEAEIVRMSVRRDVQRKSLGSRVLDGLLEAARMRKIRAVRLETTATWESAVSFYEKKGFRRTHARDGNQYMEFLSLTS